MVKNRIPTKIPVIKEKYSEWGKTYVQWLIDSKISMGQLCRALRARNTIYHALKFPDRSRVTKLRMDAYRIYIETGQDPNGVLDYMKELRHNTKLTQRIKRRIAELGLNYDKLAKELNLSNSCVCRLVNGNRVGSKNEKRLLEILGLETVPSEEKGPYIPESTRLRIEAIKEKFTESHLTIRELAYLLYGKKSNESQIGQLFLFKERHINLLEKLEKLFNENDPISLKAKAIELYPPLSLIKIKKYFEWKETNGMTDEEIASLINPDQVETTTQSLKASEIQPFWDKLTKLMTKGFLSPENNPNLTEEDLQDHDCVVGIIRKKLGGIIIMDHIKLGRWMPPVGKVKPGESIEDGLRREMREELGIFPINFQEIRNKEFSLNRNGKIVKINFHVFDIISYSGKLTNKEPNKCRKIKSTNTEWINKHRKTSHAMYMLDRALREGGNNE